METIQDVPILLRREIEALMVVPFLEAFAKELGWEKTNEIAHRVIANLADQAGKGMAAAAGGNTLAHLAKVIPAFSSGGALKMEIRENSPECLRMDVTECKYAEMYHKHGLEKIGAILSCERDNYLFAGFNPNIEFTRSETIMENGKCCDFCLKEQKKV